MLRHLVSEAPPHTRGWTVDHARCDTRHDGSPAHAGMDLRAVAARERRMGLPRTRGDGPAWSFACQDMDAAPPHTRGWTPGRCGGSSRKSGSPAHAGMDPSVSRAAWGRPRLPRTRGDGPYARLCRRWKTRAPPHTRGWTLDGYPAPERGQGSPAHAGMDPWRARRCAWSCRLPRTRGDGPPTGRDRTNPHRAPPHTRGWTLIAELAARRWSGSPAHAGMDPFVHVAAAHVAGLPRTRGDGPLATDEVANDNAAPPHTRGWTPDPAKCRKLAIGSPAHAGMDPVRDGVRWHVVGLPRTRGDGPGACIRYKSGCRAPPHTRGWTRVRAVGPRLEAGSPAHAGMDPCWCSAARRSHRLPRTRGDGPRFRRSDGTFRPAPPHTRGWTQL